MPSLKGVNPKNIITLRKNKDKNVPHFRKQRHLSVLMLNVLIALRISFPKVYKSLRTEAAAGTISAESPATQAICNLTTLGNTVKIAFA